MYTQKLFAAILQLLAHERSLITKRMLVQLTEKRFKKTQGEKWAMWQSEDSKKPPMAITNRVLVELLEEEKNYTL
jgi:hypothetical protein